MRWQAPEMSVLALARSISMPDRVLNQLRRLEQSAEDEGMMAFFRSTEGKDLIQQLTHRDLAKTARAQLKIVLDPDPEGFKMLYAMLSAAQWTRQRYRTIGIPDSIFVDTMSCFTRFTEEHRRSYGRCGFDRDFWTIRQLSARLFRLGELEFELADQPEDVPHEAHASRVINLHIPSDARLDGASCADSVARLNNFLQSFFPHWQGLPHVRCRAASSCLS